MKEIEDGERIPIFSDVAMALGADDIRDARGIAILDYDNDGDLDIAINHNPGDNGKDTAIPVVLYENRVGTKRNWLALNLVGTTSNRDAVGAEVTLKAGDLTLFRHVQAGSAYAGQQTRRVYFGLNDQERVDSITVRWPSGTVTQIKNQEINRILHIEEQVGRGTTPFSVSGGMQ